jgi:RNA polymerase sigma-70 factor (ECF subfamily)
VTAPADVAAAIADAHRHEWAFVLASTVRVTRDIDAAEEAVQDAYTRALTAWAERGIPANPGAWLTTAARRRALDGLRRAEVARRALPDIAELDAVGVGGGVPGSENAVDGFPDDRLRLVFTCCHPALAGEAQIALTLRLVCGVATPDIARAFLVTESTMAARITRAKQKIALAGIPYTVPRDDELPARLDAVLAVVHLVYSSGHTAPSGAQISRDDLAERGVDLARMLALLLPDDPDVSGLLALILLTEARRPARTDSHGLVTLLEQQRRSAWDHALIAEGMRHLAAAGARPLSRFTTMAAIAACHDASPSWEATDWPRIVALYDHLCRVWPSPVVELGRAIALGHAVGPQAGLDALVPLGSEPRLARYPYLAAARAEFLARLGRGDESRLAYDEAIVLSGNDAERASLRERRAAADR